MNAPARTATVGCPFHHGSVTTQQPAWQPTARWPQALNLGILHQHDVKTNPLAGLQQPAGDAHAGRGGAQG